MSEGGVPRRLDEGPCRFRAARTQRNGNDLESAGAKFCPRCRRHGQVESTPSLRRLSDQETFNPWKRVERERFPSPVWEREQASVRLRQRIGTRGILLPAFGSPARFPSR
jgi:hypothetical protein